jgi:hypothetical protein
MERARLGKWLLEILLKEYGITSFDKTLFYILLYANGYNKILAEGVSRYQERKLYIFKTVIKLFLQMLMHVTIHITTKPISYPFSILKPHEPQRNGIDIPLAASG